MEIWKDVPGYEDIYLVSNLGRVRRIAPTGHKSENNRIMKGGINNKGYARCELNWGGVGKWYAVHALVLSAFVGIKPEGYVTNHKNGIKTDNRLENLEYCTVSYNTQHAYDIGLAGREKHGRSKLTEEDVSNIRKEYIPIKNSYRVLGRKYGVHNSVIVDIIKNRIWKVNNAAI